MKKAIVIAGGGTKICGEYAIASQIYEKLKPSILAGNSAGAIISLVLPTIDWKSNKNKEIECALTELSLDDMFSVSPINNKGGVSTHGIIRAILGYSSFGELGNLRDTLKQFVTREDFRKYITYGKTDGVYVGSVCYNTGHRAYINLKDCTYEEALNWVMASSSIPVYTAPYKYNKYYYFDGGVRDHNPGSWILEEFGKEIDHMVSIYSRPKDYNVINQQWEPTNVLKVLERTLEIMQIEISKSDEREENLLAEKYNIKLDHLYLPNVLKGVYDTDRDRLRELYNKGKEIGKEWITKNIKK